MTGAELLADGFGRVREVVHEVLEEATADDLAARLDAEANSIAWLVWHLTRVQDDHVAAVAGTDQVWTSGWSARFALPLEESDIGYGHRPEQVAAVTAGAEALGGYHDDVYRATLRYLGTLTDADLGRVVDEHYDPPVTLAVRLVSVLADDLQHAGQAAYLRGLLQRR